MRIGLTRFKNRGSQLRMIRANRFARIALRIARATKARLVNKKEPQKVHLVRFRVRFQAVKVPIFGGFPRAQLICKTLKST